MNFFNKKYFSLKKCCFLNKSNKNVNFIENKNKNNKISDSNIKNIFEKEYFTLKELCYFFLDLAKNNHYENDENNENNDNNEKINFLCNGYLYFSSNNIKYKNYLKYIKRQQHNIKIKNTQINIRSILQEFDFEFSKLVIGIRTEKSDYDITISWDEFDNKIINCNKEILEKLNL